MSYVLLSVSGHDRPGIVRDVSEAMLHLHANIEDSSMTALRGRFTIMMIVRLPEDESLAALKAALAALEQRSGLTIQSQPLSAGDIARAAPDPDVVVTVSGADRMGIVHAVAEVLADLGISIVDLSTRSQPDVDGGAYMMALEVVAGAQAGAMRQQLAITAEKLGVDIETHAIDADIL